MTFCWFASGKAHKEFTKDDEDYHYDANPYNKCSPEYGCPKMSLIVDLDTVDENFECQIFEMPSKESIQQLRFYFTNPPNFFW